jgi:outer membrane protein TolC
VRDLCELQYKNRAIEITEENRRLLANMESTAIARLRVGRGSQADALRAQTMSDLFADRLFNLEREREVVLARLGTYLGFSGAIPWKVVESDLDPPEATRSELAKQALILNQGLNSERVRLGLLDLSTQLVETTMPLASSPASRIDLNNGAEAGPTRNSQAAFPEKPAVGHGSVRATQNLTYLEELKLRRSELRESVRAAEIDVRFQVREAYARVETAQHTFETGDQLVLPKLRRALNTTREGYNTGRVSFIEFVDTVREYLDALLAQERARRDRSLRLIDLQDSVGRTALDLWLPGVQE